MYQRKSTNTKYQKEMVKLTKTLDTVAEKYNNKRNKKYLDKWNELLKKVEVIYEY